MTRFDMRKKKEGKKQGILDHQIYDLSEEKRMINCILKDEIKDFEVYDGLKKESEENYSIPPDEKNSCNE